MSLDFNLEEDIEGVDKIIKRAHDDFYFSGGTKDNNYKTPEEYLKEKEDFD